jgi:hypothetical protein
MSKGKSIKELSAYLDGEADDAGRVSAELERSDDAARTFSELEQVSERLRALPEPGVAPAFADAVMARVLSECGDQTAGARAIGALKSLRAPDVHPGFARRVVAAIETGDSRRPATWRLPVQRAVFAAAAVAIVVAISLLSPVSTNVQTPAPEPIAARPLLEADPLDEAALLARFESRITSDTDVQQMVLARFEPSAQPADLYTARLLTALSGANATTTGEAFGHGADYRATLRRMDREQTSTVKQLLEDSVREAHEG